MFLMSDPDPANGAAEQKHLSETDDRKETSDTASGTAGKTSTKERNKRYSKLCSEQASDE
jgi:hypothetical protein